MESLQHNAIHLSIENLACNRGGRRIFEGVSFSLSSGQGVMLKGPNGTGKTTLLRTLAGFIPPSSGKINFEAVRLNGEIPFAEHCHYIGHLNGIKKNFTVLENLEFMMSYLRCSDSFQTDTNAQFAKENKTPEQVLEIFNISHLRDIPTDYLSAGQKRRVALARLILVPRPVWLLDEPSVSLDQSSQDLLSGLMRDHLYQGGLVIAVSHISLGVEFHQTLSLVNGKLINGQMKQEQPC